MLNNCDGLPIVSPASIVISVLSLTAPLIGFLRRASVLRSLFALLSPWRLLFVLLPLIILTRTSRRRRYLLLKVLLDGLFARLVTVTLAAQRVLLFYLFWIPVS